MRPIRTLLLFAALSEFCSGQTQTLFDGKSLAGWDGNPAFWRVENGVIVGETTETNPTKGNSFLIWKGGELKDFELTLKARVLGNNSGIQYRSKVVDPQTWAVGGYQMDLIGNEGLFAMLYEERGRGILARRGQRVVLRADSKPEVIGQFDRSKALDVAQWNEYRVVAQGRILRHSVNGDVTVEVIDDDVAKRSLSGVLAIQLHAGPPTRVEVKDIVLKPLSAVESVAPVASSAPQWIWTTQTAKTETIYARRQWTRRGPAKKAVLRISCDNGYSAFVNGKQVGAGTVWAQPGVYDVTAHLRAGDNVLAVEATNEGSLAGLVARLDVTDAAGTVSSLVTDKDWVVRGDKVGGWMAPSEDPKGWSRPHVHGALGMVPWGDVFNPKAAATPKPQAPAATKEAPKPIIPAVPEGFEVDLVYTVPKATQGSWVAMAVDHKGRLYCSDQGKAGIFRLTLGGAQPVVEKVPVELSGAQGLLWANGVLYAALNTSKPVAGLYRVSDTDGDDTLDRVELLREMRQGGEHGIHGVILGPDGKSLYLAGGNHSPIPSPETSSVPRNYDEDQLLPRMIDSRGHAKGVKAPGGWVARTDMDGKAFHLMAAGFRNQYDLAFNDHGELFTYDSDMEWDLGAPWYRPTRMYHVVDGADFGWRTGSGKFPAWFPDTLPPALDVGPGSPTGVEAGRGTRFPAKYQQAIFAFDWTYGTIYAMHPVARGSSYVMEKEEFVAGNPLPVTDGAVGPDGNFYFAIGGRGKPSAVYRVRYAGAESTAPVLQGAGPDAALRVLRRSMEALQRPTAGAVDRIWPQLGHADRFVRYAARVALEHQAVAQWQDRALAETDSETALSALLALARQGDAKLQPKLLDRLTYWSEEITDEAQRLALYRVLGLTMIRMGEPGPERAGQLASVLTLGYPAASDALNRELVALLVALKSPDVLVKTIPLMQQEAVASETLAVDEELLKRSGGGRNFLEKPPESNPQRQQIWYAYALRVVKSGWSPKLRKDYFTWFAKARNFKGGASFGGFLDNMRKEALEGVSDPAERAALDALSQKPVRAIPEGYESARTVRVGVKPGLKFDTELLEAAAGEKLAIEFVNDDPTGMMHNLALGTPGSLQKIITAAMNIGPKAMEQNFVPEIPEVLGSTPQVAPGRKYTLYLSVPNAAGDYPFVCTYPGHGQVMNGVLRVRP